jgi:RNA polymerase sigma-70 factor, ECF subfamily
MSTTNQLTDEQLIEIVRTSDKNQYAELMHRYESKLLRYVTYLVTDEQLAADIVQETFIKAYIHANGFNLKQKFSSWLYRIAHNQAINAVTHHKPVVRESDMFTLVESTENIEDDFIRKELHTQLHHCLSELPVQYREPLVLFFLEEKSYQEISDILRLPMGTVSTRINRAKQFVKTLCQKKL